MLISEANQKVVLNLSKPERVTGVIPTARAFEYRGQTLVAVPHRLDEVRVLRNLGICAPSPIKHHYRWPGRYQPFHAQRETAEFLTLNPKAFVLNDMGTGKTLASLWAYDYLRVTGKVRRALVISPLSTLERTWADEVFEHFPHLTTAVLHGPKERRLKQLASDADIFLVNHDGLKVIEQELIARDEIDLIIIDEIASFRNASTGRWKSLNRVCAGKEYIWGLTGTPTPNLPTDAWAQCRIIAPERVPRYAGKFRDATMKQLGQFKWVARENANDIVAEAMQPAIRFSRDQCVDLPEAIYQTRQAALTPEQSDAYKSMVAKLRIEYAGEQALAVNEAVKMSKLTQIACGVVYGNNGEEIVLPTYPRIAVCREAIEESGTKTIVFVPFTAVLNFVAEELAKDFKVECISGATSKSQRDRIFREFQHEPNGPQVLVANPAAMSHGLTLTAASTVVWYGPTTSNEIYQQANARVTRPGQKHTQFIVNIEATEIERRIFKRLQAKQTMQGLLLDTLKSTS